MIFIYIYIYIIFIYVKSPAVFNHVITGQMENQISILFQRLWLPNLAACELREDVPHPLNHLTF